MWCNLEQNVNIVIIVIVKNWPFYTVEQCVWILWETDHVFQITQLNEGKLLLGKASMIVWKAKKFSVVIFPKADMIVDKDDMIAESKWFANRFKTWFIPNRQQSCDQQCG